MTSGAHVTQRQMAAEAGGSQAVLLTFEPTCDVAPVIVGSQPKPSSARFYATCIL